MPTGQSRTGCAACDSLPPGQRRAANALLHAAEPDTRPGRLPVASTGSGRPAWSFQCHRFGYPVCDGAGELVAPDGRLSYYRDEQDARARFCDPCAHLTGSPGSHGCTLDREVAKCGALVAPGTCEGRCTDCAEWPTVCAQTRAAIDKGVPSPIFPCPPGFGGESCVGCPHLRAEVLNG